MMGFVQVAVAVFSLLSLGQSAPVTSCENLVQPISISGRDQLLGTWYYQGEATDLPGSSVLTKRFIDSAWWNVTAASQDNVILTFQNQKTMGYCYSVSYPVTLELNALVIDQPHYTSRAFLLSTGCPDCLVVYTNYTLGFSSCRGLQILSRRIKVSAAEQEEYKKQVECLKLPAPTILEEEKGFCSDPSISQATRLIDFSTSTKDLGSEFVNWLDKLFKSENGIQVITDMLSAVSESFTSSTKTVGN